MRKCRPLLFLLLAVLLAAPAPSFSALAEVIPGELTREGLVFQSEYPAPETVLGQSPTTGLSWEGLYAPVLVVLDNAQAAYPHWGIADADLVYQVPNAGAGATKLLALYSDSHPEAAGGSRSTRTPFVDVAREWGAAFAYAGTPSLKQEDKANVQSRLRAGGMRWNVKAFNLLGNNDFTARIKGYSSPHNLSVNVRAVRDLSVKNGAVYPASRAFLFSDALPLSGVPATEFTVAHFGERAGTDRGNADSYSRFVYQPAENAYWREHAKGWDVDRDTPDVPLAFANVIIQRVKFTYSGPYVLLESLDGTGAADIFTGGRYVRGGWFRQDADSRTVFVDEAGKEIMLQRGKTFIILTNEVTRVSLVQP